MIEDAANHELTFWAISGLIEGDDSDVIIFTPKEQGQRIKATDDDRVIVWCRQEGVGPYVDISNGELDVSGLTLGAIDFQVFVEAVGPISGLERIPITVSVGSSSPAGWLS